MSTSQNMVKLATGKKKIEIKKIESYPARMVAFSKRKAGIYKKMNELIPMCGVEAAFLTFSEGGKPFSFAHPSMDQVAERLMNSLSVKDHNNNTGSLGEAITKQKINDLMREYMDLVEEFEVDDKKMKGLTGSMDGKDLNTMWWSSPLVSTEELLKRHQTFTEFHRSLCDVDSQRLGKDKDGSSPKGLGPTGGGKA